MKRRILLKGTAASASLVAAAAAGLLIPFRLLAGDWPQTAFESDDAGDAIKDYFGDAAVVRFLRASDLVQLGAEVPIGMDAFDNDWTTIRVSIVPEAIGETVLIEWNFISDDTPDTYSGLSIDDVRVGD